MEFVVRVVFEYEVTFDIIESLVLEQSLVLDPLT